MDLEVDLETKLSHWSAFKPSKYYEEFGDKNPKMVDGRSCKSWRVEKWTKFPQHKESDVQSTFVLGIGPPKTATTSTFTSLASNPNICFYRDANDGGFSEVVTLFGSRNRDTSTSNLLSHLAPSDCCEAVVMKDPRWATSFQAVYDMKKLLGTGENVKFVLTVREIASAFNSKFDYICSHTEKSQEILDKICVDGDSYVDNIESDSRQMDECVKDITANSGLQGSELVNSLEKCITLLAVQSYDYEATFKRYADQFGDEKIICQFMTDLISAGDAATRRSIFDHAGLTNLDENNAVSTAKESGEKTYRLDNDQKERIIQISAKYNTNTYDEDRLRAMCVKQTAH